MTNKLITSFRNQCLTTYINSPVDEPVENIVKVLIEEAAKTTLNKQVAINIINAIFVRKYDADGKYITTLAPNLPKTNTPPNETKEPDFELADTLSKADLDAYAATFDIALNQSNTKSNMLLDFKDQWEAK